MSLESDPTAMVLFQYEKACGELPNETVREHAADNPLITLMSCENSAW